MRDYSWTCVKKLIASGLKEIIVELDVYPYSKVAKKIPALGIGHLTAMPMTRVGMGKMELLMEPPSQLIDLVIRIVRMLLMAKMTL